jgi:hypothetical protein
MRQEKGMIQPTIVTRGRGENQGLFIGRACQNKCKPGTSRSGVSDYTAPPLTSLCDVPGAEDAAWQPAATTMLD